MASPRRSKHRRLREEQGDPVPLRAYAVCLSVRIVQPNCSVLRAITVTILSVPISINFTVQKKDGKADTQVFLCVCSRPILPDEAVVTAYTSRGWTWSLEVSLLTY